MNACDPFATDVVSKFTEYGAVLSVSNATALRKNSTNAREVSSDGGGGHRDRSRHGGPVRRGGQTTPSAASHHRHGCVTCW